MDFTQRITNLLIWFWTTYILTGLNAVNTKLTAVKTELETSVSNVQTSLNSFQTSVNGSISSINTSIQDLQTYATSGLVAEYLFNGSGWDATKEAYVLENTTMIAPGSKAGRYVFYMGGHSYNLTNDGTIDTIRINFKAANDYLVDYNDEVSVMYDGTEITSVRVISRRNIRLNEEDVKMLIEEYFDENPFSVS